MSARAVLCSFIHGARDQHTGHLYFTVSLFGWTPYWTWYLFFAGWLLLFFCHQTSSPPVFVFHSPSLPSFYVLVNVGSLFSVCSVCVQWDVCCQCVFSMILNLLELFSAVYFCPMFASVELYIVFDISHFADTVGCLVPPLPVFNPLNCNSHIFHLMKWKLDLRKLSLLSLILHLFLFCTICICLCVYVCVWAVSALLLSVSPLWLWEHGLSDTVSSSINKRRSQSRDRPFPSLIR